MALAALAGLSACIHRHEASVERSSIRFATVLRGEIFGPGGGSRTALYVRRPFPWTANSESALFRIEPNQKHAVRVSVRFGDVVVENPGASGDRPYVEMLTGNPNVEVLSGLQRDDRIILSDMSAFTEPRIELY